MKNLKVPLLLVGFFFVTTFISAQSKESETIENNFAVMFQVDDLLSFSGLDGAVFSGEYLLSKESAIRFGISTYYIKGDKTVESFYNDSLLYTPPSSGNATKMKFVLYYVRHLMINDDISFFGGAGISYAYSNSTSEEESSLYRNKYDNTDYSFGLPLIAGVEWFVRKNLSLSLEYGISAEYEKSSRNQTQFFTNDNSTQKDNVEEKTYSIKNERVKMGIAFYF